MKIACTDQNVIFEWFEEEKLKSGQIELLSALSRDTRWARCVAVGTDSTLRPGDMLLLSARVTTYKFEIDGKEYHNTSDKSTMAFKRDCVLRTTNKTILYTFNEELEQKTESGIVLATSVATKELRPIWATVRALSDEAMISGLKVGDHVLLAPRLDCYSIKIDSLDMHNMDYNDIILYEPR